MPGEGAQARPLNSGGQDQPPALAAQEDEHRGQEFLLLVAEGCVFGIERSPLLEERSATRSRLSQCSPMTPERGKAPCAQDACRR
jgi:hypothetical protein